MYQPLESPNTTAGSAKPQTAKLTITHYIALQDGRGPQIAVCSVAPSGDGAESQAFTAVAKIYDPLYYPFHNKRASWQPTDAAAIADTDYIQEAAAYEHLKQRGETGRFAPEYHGSWTFTMPICYERVVRQRPVRLILIEYLECPCMGELCSNPRSLGYDEGYRLDVLAKILDGYSRLNSRGLGTTRVLSPRHLFLLPEPEYTTESQPIPRVVLIDYTEATVQDSIPEEEEGHDHTATEPPLNPMDWFWDESLVEFDGWRPPRWNGNPRPRQEWLMKEFGGENAAKYRPVREGLELDPPKDFVHAHELDYRPGPTIWAPPPAPRLLVSHGILESSH